MSGNMGDELLRLNVGGRSFWLPINLLLSGRNQGTLLGKMAAQSHQERLQIAFTYLSMSQEYYFSSSTCLFKPIFRFHISGHLHPPHKCCIEEFLQELDFWGVDRNAIGQCVREELRGGETDGDQKDNERRTMREHLWHLLEGGGRSSTIFQVFSLSVLVLSFVGLVLGTIDDFRIPVDAAANQTTNLPKSATKPHPKLDDIECLCMAYFTVEYLIRLLLAPSRLEFLKAPLNIIDLTAILPFYLELGLHAMGIDSQGLSATVLLRTVRVLRVARIVRLSAHTVASQVFLRAFKRVGQQLGACLLLMMLTTIFFSTVVYFMEEGYDGTPITSIPAGFWWCLVTMTTVGYGDVVPATVQGKLVSTLAILSGVLVMALPITVIVNNFTRTEKYEVEVKLAERREQETTNPANMPLMTQNKTICP